MSAAIIIKKPSQQQMDSALAAATRLREKEDPEALGHYLLYLHERSQHLEDIYAHVQHYLRSGQAAREHSMLLRAIEKAEKAAHPHEDAAAVFPGD
ncbi:MAG TPA: hypothetical protein VLB90_05740 [Pseudomonadales bacterium]|nr:hypothetical protein [Pseudomonadales bacterium]